MTMVMRRGQWSAPQLTPIDPAAPFDVARIFLTREYSDGNHHTLLRHRGAFYSWNGAAYITIADDDLRAKLYVFLDQCETSCDRNKKIKPKRTLVNLVFDALFAKYMMDNLKPAGTGGDRQKESRCGVIVPEGVLFGSTGGHKELRRMLMQNNRVDCVLSPPGSVFQPSSGVKTSALMFSKVDPPNGSCSCTPISTGQARRQPRPADRHRRSARPDRRVP